jgi:hypothetical protein
MGVSGSIRGRVVAVVSGVKTGLGTLTLGTGVVGSARSRGGAVLIVKAAEDIAVGHGRR